MWCPCLCQLPNRNSRTGKKLKFFFKNYYFSAKYRYRWVFTHFRSFHSLFCQWWKTEICISVDAEFMLRCLWMIARCHFEMCTRFITQRWRYSRTEDLLWFWLFFIRIDLGTDTFFSEKLLMKIFSEYGIEWLKVPWLICQSISQLEYVISSKLVHVRQNPSSYHRPPVWRIRWEVTICSTTQRTEACWTSLTARKQRSSRLQIPFRSLLFRRLLLILHLLLWLRYFHFLSFCHRFFFPLPIF